MKDGEVLLWLTEKERAAWVRAETAGDDDELAVALWAAMRSLAATRRALLSAQRRAVEQECGCPVCERLEYEGHAPDCIIATMPRPR